MRISGHTSPWRWCGVECAALLPLSNPFLQTCQGPAPVLVPSLGSSRSRGPRCSRAVAVTLCRTSTFRATLPCPFLSGPSVPEAFVCLVQWESKGCGSLSLSADPLGLLQESPSSFKRTRGPKAQVPQAGSFPPQPGPRLCSVSHRIAQAGGSQEHQRGSTTEVQSKVGGSGQFFCCK